MLYADTIESVQRDSDQELFFLTIEAIPEKNNPAFYKNDYGSNPDEITGAYISCYIHVDSLQQAEQTALDDIVKNGWRPVAFRWCSILECQQYQDDPEWEEERAYITEAFSSGAAFLYHLFSGEEEEDEEDTGEWIRFVYDKNKAPLFY